MMNMMKEMMIDLEDREKCCLVYNQNYYYKPSQRCQKSVHVYLQTVQVLNISFSMYKMVHLYTEFENESLCAGMK